jgi:hypothetical protein
MLKEQEEMDDENLYYDKVITKVGEGIIDTKSTLRI